MTGGIKAIQISEPNDNAKVSVARIESFMRQLKPWNIAAYFGLLTFITTLAFEYGRAEFWGFPTELVRFSQERAFQSFISLVIVSLTLGYVIQFILFLEIKWILGVAGLILIVAVTFLIVLVMNRWNIFSVYSMIFGAAYAIWALGYCWKKVEGKRVGTSKFKITKLLVEILGEGGLALTATIILVPYFSFAVGFFAAYFQEDFIVTTTEPKRVVLAVYGSQAVCATLQSAEKEKWISRTFDVLDLTGELFGSISKERMRCFDINSRFIVMPVQ